MSVWVFFYFNNMKDITEILDWKTPNSYNNNFDVPINKSGVYAIVKTKLSYNFKKSKNKSKLMYIGSSASLVNRITSHEVYLTLLKTCSSEYHIRIFFKYNDNYKELEKELIKKYKPLLNIQHNR